WRRAGLWRHVLYFLRLYARVDPARGAVGVSSDLCLYTRQHWAGRGRANPPAHRATGGHAGDSEPGAHPPRRRERERGGLAPSDGARAWTDGAGLQPPETAGVRSDQAWFGAGPAQGRVYAAGRSGWAAGDSATGDRLRGRAGATGACRVSQAGHARAGGQLPKLGAVRGAVAGVS